MIVKATQSFTADAGGTRHEVHKGDLLSNTHPTVVARPKDFAKASERDVRDAVNSSRG